jgi:hypothetical protein
MGKGEMGKDPSLPFLPNRWEEVKEETIPSLPFLPKRWAEVKGETIPSLPFLPNRWEEVKGETIPSLPFSTQQLAGVIVGHLSPSKRMMGIEKDGKI